MNNTNSKQKIFKSFLWKVLERVSVQGINLVVQIVLARLLLPEHFGNLAIIVAIVNYASIFVQTGFSTAIIQKEGIDDLDVSTLFVTSLGISSFFYVLLYFLSPSIASIYGAAELIWPLRVLGILLFLNSINSIQTAIYSRRMEFKKIFLRSIISVPISGVVGIILAIRGLGLWALVIHNVLNTLIIIVVMFFDKTCRIGFKFSFERLKRLLPFSIKILLTGVVTGAGDFFRTLFIGKKYSKEELAYYDKAFTYSNYVTQIVGQSITSVMLPSLSREQNDLLRMKTMARKSIGVSAFVMFPVLLGFAAISNQFVIIFLTDKWEACVPFLMLFCVLRMPAFISNIDKQVYYAIGKSGINLVYEIIFLVINLSVIIFALQFGVIYIAIGVTISEWLGCLCVSIISKHVYNYTIGERLSDIAKPIFNSLIMFILVYRIQNLNLNLYLTLVLQIILGVVTYLLLAVFTGDKNIHELYSLLNRRTGGNNND